MADGPVTPGRQPYVPPSGDEPLDDIELALVRALVPLLVAKIREGLATRTDIESAATAKPPKSQGARGRTRSEI